MPHQPVSIIIPVYNKWQLTAACLRSLYTHAPRRPFEVIVVDNASRDATVGELPILGYELFGDGFRRIRNADNRNFAGACNQGARAASHEFLFFLNNDTLLTPAWDSPLFAALADDPGLGAVGPLLLFENGTVQHAGVAVQPDRSIRHFYGGIPGLHPLAQKRRKLAFITAAALLIRKKDFFAAGAFYEGYVNGFEDIELCYRLRQAGFTLSVIPESVICHLDGGTRREDPDAPRNAPLLSRRCPDLRKPEFHRIALEDGYTVVLGPLFETLLQPAPERLAAYASLIGREDAAALQVVLDTEIYWLEGWEALARTREKEDGPDAALAVMRKSFRFHQTPVVMEEILRLAEKTGERDAIAEFAERLASARETMRDRRFLQAKLDSTLRIAAALEDDALEHLAKAWRKQFGKKLLARPE